MTDETNLVAIYRAGWRFWPAQEDVWTETLSSGQQVISPQLHQACLDESFEQYTNIWKKLGKGLSGN